MTPIHDAHAWLIEDDLNGQGILLTTLTNLPNVPQDISYSFTPAQLNDFINYLSGNNFGLGFDPDCHYFNEGIELTVQTKSVPEPKTLLLLGSGLTFMAFFLRRRKK